MHLLKYVLNTKSDFLEVIENNFLEDYFIYKNFDFKNSFTIEGKLFNEEVIIDLYDSTVIITIFIKYSQFLNNPDYETRIKLFEDNFISFKSLIYSIIRVDESLIEDFSEIVNNEFWFLIPDNFVNLKKWVVSQEKLHWKILC